MANFCVCRREMEAIKENLAEIERMIRIIVLGMTPDQYVSPELEAQIREIAAKSRQIDQKVPDRGL